MKFNKLKIEITPLYYPTLPRSIHSETTKVTDLFSENKSVTFSQFLINLSIIGFFF